MTTGVFGTFVISWSQTEIDGLRGAPPSAVEPGTSWCWHGRAVRIDGPAGVLPLGPASDQAALKARASLAARRLLGRSAPPVRAIDAPEFSDPLVGPGFTVTDGREAWTATLVEVPEAARPLLMFAGELPPRDRVLRVARGLERSPHVHRVSGPPVGVICFTPGTRLRTPNGERPVETLREGEAIDTVDGGPQEIVWIGRRRMSGARLHALPELRPVRVKSGALGQGDPRGDLVVSPRHRVLIRGAVASSLFNADEVLVSAEDLVNDHSIVRDHTLAEVDYVHLLLPRHHVVWANGVQTESFHPASTDLDTIDPVERARLREIVPGIEEDPTGYGAPARRELTRSEAAIFCREAGPLR